MAGSILFEVNGHVYPEVDQHDWGTSFAERPLLFHNVPDGPGKGRKFEYVPPVKGSGLAVVVPGRGAAFGDLFNDGKIDVVINPVDGPPVLLQERESGSSSLGGDGIGWRSKESARCDVRHGIPEGKRHAAAAGCAVEWKLYFRE